MKVWNPGKINDRPPKSVFLPPAVTSLIAMLGDYSSVAGSKRKRKTHAKKMTKD